MKCLSDGRERTTFSYYPHPTVDYTNRLYVIFRMPEFGVVFFIITTNDKGSFCMSKGLEYFKKVYDIVPGWVQKMHDYNPEMLDHYTALRGAAMSAGALTVKEKDILLVGMNAARHYARSMVYHTKGAIDGGATLEELVEYLLIAYNYGGDKALQIGLQSFEYALELKGVEGNKISHDSTAEEIARYYSSFASTDESRAYYNDLIALFAAKDENALTEKLLEANVVAKDMKYILMTGIYTTVLKNEETDHWAKKARENGADEPRLAELGYICLLTAGIPSWFEISDALIEK